MSEINTKICKYCGENFDKPGGNVSAAQFEAMQYCSNPCKGKGVAKERYGDSPLYHGLTAEEVAEYDRVRFDCAKRLGISITGRS
jgi:hypothetical protein